MGKIKDNMAKMKCSECKRITTYTQRNKKKVKEKLSLKKYCKFCRKHTLHNESK
jgi:large subunit ribosomal protein L33